jgi:hypothetical protein
MSCFGGVDVQNINLIGQFIRDDINDKVISGDKFCLTVSLTLVALMIISEATLPSHEVRTVAGMQAAAFRPRFRSLWQCLVRLLQFAILAEMENKSKSYWKGGFFIDVRETLAMRSI